MEKGEVKIFPIHKTDKIEEELQRHGGTVREHRPWDRPQFPLLSQLLAS
jgi:hypothetical protein